MSGPTATFSDPRGGGSFLGTRPPWEESSGRSSNPDQSPNFGMSPEFSQGSIRPPGEYPEYQAYYQRWQRMGSYIEPCVSESGGPSLERLRSRSLDLPRPETPESGRRSPEAAASREQPSSTFSRGGVPERESASAYYDLGRGGAGRPSSPPHPTMGEARRRRFGDRGSALWEDPYSPLLGMPVEPSAENFLQTMGARRQELYQQGASGFQGSGPLCPGQGQVHRDPEPQGGGQLGGVPCPSSVCWGSTAWAAPHCRFAACACARACGLTVQVAQATKEEVSCGEG